MGEKKLLIDMRGIGEISLNGKCLHMPNKKPRAILYMLALSPRFQLSRSLLRARLWSDRSEAQSAASLRQALTILRNCLLTLPGALIITREYVALDHSLIQLKLPDTKEMLLAGLDINDQAFEDWLRQERVNHEIKIQSQLSGNLQSEITEFGDQKIVGIGILPCVFEGDSPHGAVVGDIVSDLIARDLDNFGIATAYDYRHSTMPVESPQSISANCVDMFMQINIHLLDHYYFIHCKFYDSLDNRQLWSGYCKVAINAGYLESIEFRVFVNEILDVALFIFNSSGFIKHSDQRVSSKLALSAINEILKGRDGDLRQADHFLDQAYAANNNSVYLGWKTHIVAYMLGERIIENPAEHRERLRETVLIAEEQGRFNPVTLALVAHTYSFIFHNYKKALDTYARMFDLNPTQAICFDLSAVTNVYVNNKKLAYEQSQLALKLGRFSPYRYCIYTTCSMACAINKRYEEAIHYGHLATDIKPTFTAALRYLIAAQFHSGDTKSAQESFNKFMLIEPDFSVVSIQNDDYPVAEIGETANIIKSAVSGLSEVHREL